jgi:hypothetical protein
VELRGCDVSDGADAAHELARAGGSDERRERLPPIGDVEDADQASLLDRLVSGAAFE